MSKRKLRRLVLPTLYAVTILSAIFIVMVINSIVLKPYTSYDYSKSLMKDVTQATLKETEDTSKKIVQPFQEQTVEMKISYYDMADDDERKEKSLILYQNTYMPSSGTFYGSSEEFEVLSVMDGKITKINEEDILGTSVEITHNTNLTTYYYSIKDLMVKEGDDIKAGFPIGKASTNKINEKENNFLFEVYYQGKSLDPEKFYQMNVDELQ